ncbi:MAG: cation transporter [Porticoccaceae bacterium]
MTSSIASAENIHSHVFNEGNPLAEKNTARAAVLTAMMMVAEIVGGWTYNSMALLADGWHMSSHALALGLSVVAYVFARRFAQDARFAFGTWKIEILAGYTSALLLGIEPDYFRKQLASHDELVHVAVEVNTRRAEHAMARGRVRDDRQRLAHRAQRQCSVLPVEAIQLLFYLKC